MPVIKPVFTATSTAPIASGGVITTTVNPTATRFSAAIDAGMIGATEITILAASFVDDDNVPVVALPVITANDYYNVYVNGVLQQGSLSTLTTANLVLDAIDISIGVPIMLEVTSFSNTTSDLTTPQTISAPTITIIT